MAEIIEALRVARTACILPGFLANRAGLEDAVQAFVDVPGLPFATMFADKSALEEQQPAYIGMYDGKLMDEAVREFVESCDSRYSDRGHFVGLQYRRLYSCILTRKRPSIFVTIVLMWAQRFIPNVEMKDVLAELARRVAETKSKTTASSRLAGTRNGSRQRSDYRRRSLCSLGEFH